LKKVFIGIPNTGTVVIGLAELICHWVGKQEFGIVPYFSKYHKPMMFHRNHIVNTFLKTDCEYLLWIDDDVVPPPNAIEKLIAHDVDAVSALCFCTRPNDAGAIAPYPVTMKDAPNGEYLIYFPQQPLDEIDACGGGCVLVKRSLYEHPEMKAPYQHSMKENGEMGATCDFNIWKRARAAGFKLYVDSTVVCSHIREIDLKEFNRTLMMVGMQGQKVNG
jgi:GT2 family glycosyltransferase